MTAPHPAVHFLGKPVSAVIFDMDGLLLDTERISLRSWQAGAAAAGVPMPDEVFLDMIGRRHQDCLAVLRRYAGHEINESVVSAAMYADYDRRLAQSIPVMPGARELLTFLHNSGLPLAVATSTRGDLARKKLDTVHLLSFFRSVTGGDSVEHGKPAPDIYLAAAATLGIAPEECAAFEDSSPGTLSAAAAGMRAVIVPDLKAPSSEARAVAAAQITSLLEAPALFQ